MAAATIAGPDDNGAWRTTTREPAPESLPNTLTSSQGEVGVWREAYRTQTPPSLLL
jgi:hypothetical protein